MPPWRGASMFGWPGPLPSPPSPPGLLPPMTESHRVDESPEAPPESGGGGRPRIVCTLPTYEEADNILPLCRELLSLSDDLQVLVIDDDSPDGTWKLVQREAEGEPRLHLLHRTSDRGRGSAGREGFVRALQMGAEIVVEMDADYSHHPRYVPQLIERLEREGHDVGLVVEPRLPQPCERSGVALVAGQQVRPSEWVHEPLRPDHADVAGVALGVVEPVDVSARARAVDGQVEGTVREVAAGDRVGRPDHGLGDGRELAAHIRGPGLAVEMHRRFGSLAEVRGPGPCGGVRVACVDGPSDRVQPRARQVHRGEQLRGGDAYVGGLVRVSCPVGSCHGYPYHQQTNRSGCRRPVYSPPSRHSMPAQAPRSSAVRRAAQTGCIWCDGGLYDLLVPRTDVHGPWDTRRQVE